MPFPKNSKTKTFYEHKRSFHLIFQAGNSAFLRLPLFFPVVGTVKVFGRYIDRLTKAPNGPISSPQNTRGYAHCSSICVTVGQKVKQGEVIGYVGTTGNSTGNHLHFEVWQNGERTDALNFFSAKDE